MEPKAPARQQHFVQPTPSSARKPPPPYPDHSIFVKGALVTIDSTTGTTQTTLPFQYNPHTLRRSLKPNEVGSTESDRSQAVRFTGAAVETISVEAYLDAVDALEKSDTSIASSYGVHPLLAALELLIYPTTADVSSYYSNADGGSWDIVPPLAPQLVFVWGPNRVMPVRLASLAVTEEFFDGSLNPISATVALEMRVLTYSDVFSNTQAYTLWMTHQQHMETMAGWVQSEVNKMDLTRVLGTDTSNIQGAEATPVKPSGG